MTVAGAFHLSDLVLLVIGVLWLPGMYQIDHPLQGFIPETVLEMTIFAGALAVVAAGIATTAVAGTRWMRSRGVPAR